MEYDAPVLGSPRRLHDGLLVMHGQAPYGIQVHWVYGPPLPVGLDPEARQAMIAARIAEIFKGLLPGTETSPTHAREHTRPSRDTGRWG